ncbi:MAG: hypothetical protein ACUVR3_07955 [Candidatus Roseilinea sp.]|uniref:hypothetical protein n=1 Tax=Candidatus Roseilinea sp. TaxID=2838777 RepID=UPI00404AAAB6
MLALAGTLPTAYGRDRKVETQPMRKPASLAERLAGSATITPLRQLTGRVIVWRNNLAPEAIEPLAARRPGICQIAGC